MPFGSPVVPEVSIKKLRLLSRFRFLFILFSFIKLLVSNLLSINNFGENFNSSFFNCSLVVE